MTTRDDFFSGIEEKKRERSKSKFFCPIHGYAQQVVPTDPGEWGCLVLVKGLHGLERCLRRVVKQ